MIDLKDVSYKEILCKYNNTDFERLCNHKKVKNLEDVFNIYKDYQGKERVMLDRDFHRLFKRLKITNLKDGKPNVYEIDSYSDDSLYYNDMLNKGNILIFDTPTSKVSHTYDDVKKMKISDIKYDISHCMINGHSYLEFICNRIGGEKLLIIQRALNNYVAQIERQALLTDDRNINLFTYQKAEKVKVISDMIGDLILYLIDNSSELLWGQLNEFRYNLYKSSIHNNLLKDREIREAIIEYISNYVTLEEAYNLLNDKKILKRFIVR